MSEKSPVPAIAGIVVAVVVLAALLGTSDHSSTRKDIAPEALDQSSILVSSCSFDEMLTMTNGIPTVSGEDAAAICTVLTDSLGHRPQINVLRAAFKCISLMRVDGLKDPDSDLAKQLMQIVEARGITDPKRIISTFDTVCKIVGGTSGQVTPQDLDVALRDSGPMAHTLSEDGLISMATLIWEQKKANND